MVKDMRNKGRISVFMSLITSVCLILITCVLQAVILSTAESKAVITSRLAMSDVKACYNTYIFEHYHILLFDKEAGGKGEAYLEEQLARTFSDNLGSEYQDTQVAITDFTMVYDDSCAAVYEQMQSYIKYVVAEAGISYGVDALLEKTGGEDGTLPDELMDVMQEAEDETEQGKENAENQTDTMLSEEKPAQLFEERDDDPRDYTKKMDTFSLLRLVLPEGKDVSTAGIILTDLPSYSAGVMLSDYEEIDRSFDSMPDMTSNLLEIASWSDKLSGKAVLSAYIRDVFNSYTEQRNDTSVLQYEQEYLIAGKSSDFENLESVMNQIIGIRFPIDYIGICAQSQKMAEMQTLATSICVAAPYMIPVVKYLLAGCWAYIEAIADVRVLFSGEKLAFAKTSANWITDIDDIEGSITRASGGDENGLSYEDYLMILQMLNSDAVVYRMLDLMQINAGQDNPEFRIENAACGFESDFQTTFRGQTWQFHQSVSY